MEMRVKLIGLNELMLQLDQLNRVLRAHIIGASLKAAAMSRTERKWKQLAPVLTGNYRRSIHTSLEDVTWDYAHVVVGTDIVDPPYPWFLEVGTSRMAARPSARPAFDATKKLVERDTVRFVNGLIMQVAPPRPVA